MSINTHKLELIFLKNSNILWFLASFQSSTDNACQQKSCSEINHNFKPGIIRETICNFLLSPLSCIGKKELFHVHIKLDDVTRATTFWQGIIWKWGCTLMWVLFELLLCKFTYAILITVLRAQTRTYYARSSFCASIRTRNLRWVHMIWQHPHWNRWLAITTRHLCYMSWYGMSAQFGQTPDYATAR